MMQQNYNDLLICLGCNKQYNLEDRLPLRLPCEDEICSQCYKNQVDQVQNQQIQCPSDSTHLFGIDEPAKESKLMIRMLQKLVYDQINCKEHQENQVQFYCQNQNTIICALCFAIESHQKCYQETIAHFAFERKFLVEAFEKITPTLQEQINQIKILLESIQTFINKKRNFNADEIEQMIIKICSILQLSAFDDQIKKNLKLRESFRNIRTTDNEEQKQDLVLTQEEITIKELGKQVTDLQNQLREVSDQLETQSKLHKEDIKSLRKENKDKLDSQYNQHQAEIITQFQECQAKLESQSKDFQIKLENSQKDNQAELDKLSKDNQNKQEVLSREYQVKFDEQSKETLKFKTYAKELEEKMEQLKNEIAKGTRDGFQAFDFHKHCDNQGPTISFIKSEHGQIFGGYTSLSWTSANGQYYKDNNAFLFNLNKNTLHKQYQNFDNAVRHQIDYQMTFGGGFDINISNNCNNNNSSYCRLGYTYMPPQGFKYDDQYAKDYLAGSYKFKVIEIEVYSVLE
ncbi:tldc domain-containing protein [Stylonychia lemnae]|uniref:Tldc domain-containing protein n=1 Tax=Stylonychia lemnae TaxID=5949 RepID=A0A077ZVX4_STYLE|nr:tldc domain-containing protein [Stylonychia lemnae]|eukprot:CDW73405.1 tldc domain-containing protein [Stylonychia lemnae]